MTDSTIYYIWLQIACGINSGIYQKLFERFDCAEDIYNCDDFSFLNNKYISEENLYKKDLSQAFEVQKTCNNNDISIITYHSPDFPESLRYISAPPAALYCKGKPRDLNNEVCIAIVGTRQMTSHGGATAEHFAYNIARSGGVVVSGLAKGIDTVAHRGALRGEGFTVAVLGTPIDEIYPLSNSKLFYRLYDDGLVISEMYPGCKKSKYDFPARNRIISALSKAVIIAQAGEKSGALITANYAVAQGKQVYAIPGPLGSDNAGTNELIKKGVEVATNPLDVLGPLALDYPTKIKTENMSPFGSRFVSYGDDDPYPQTTQTNQRTIHKVGIPKPKQALGSTSSAPDSIEDTILKLLGNNKPLTADEIAVGAALDIGEVFTSLTLLEIEGKVISLAGNKFIAKKA